MRQINYRSKEYAAVTPSDGMPPLFVQSSLGSLVSGDSHHCCWLSGHCGQK